MSLPLALTLMAAALAPRHSGAIAERKGETNLIAVHSCLMLQGERV